MSRWSIDVGGVQLVPYFQLYAIGTDLDRRGELLSHPLGVDGVEGFFGSLTYEQHVEVVRWQLELKEDFGERTGHHVSLNVHNSLVADLDRQESFLELVSEYPTPATFEFTETHPMPPVIESNLLLRRLREMGHRSALDDFGAGLNGMSLLTDYDFDVVKLDRSLVYDINTRIQKSKTVSLIGQMLNVLGKLHVVEGIETEEIRQILVETGFTTFQGFAIHRPEPLEALASRLITEATP